MQDKTYYVYIMSSKTKVIYTGITSNIIGRVYQHKNGLIKGFTKRYNVDQLVYYTGTNDIMEAICYEKKIKGWLRNKKITLIESINPDWIDLAKDWDFSVMSF